MLNGNELALERCPHCSIAKPRIYQYGQNETTDAENRSARLWTLYSCRSCGGMILTVAVAGGKFPIQQMWPDGSLLSDAIPERAREYLKQASESLHAPSAAQMLAASSVDSMLKEKGYKDGSLYSRIKAAHAAHLITEEMALWAHEVRLDANDQRHADEEPPLPKAEDAKRTIEFAKALAEFLFVLPAAVTRGRTTKTAESS